MVDLKKLQKKYPGSTLIPRGSFSERELQMLATIEQWEYAFTLWDSNISCSGSTQDRMRALMPKED